MKKKNIKQFFTKEERIEIQEFVSRLLWRQTFDHTAGFEPKYLDKFGIKAELQTRQDLIKLSPLGAIRLLGENNNLVMTNSIIISNLAELEEKEVEQLFMIAMVYFKKHVFKLHKPTEDELKYKEIQEMEDEEEKKKLIEKMRQERMKEMKNKDE